ncbi:MULTISPECIES: hypothetical protein [unclassified Streptomyces]|uniref:hypothetical protein n=1 Tax=Streptomyces sp. ST1020 TaxID=1848901 RepID=UPI001EFE2E3C|nr:hypothetical protein [Streptomyces sp. ST1020]
MTPGTKLRQPDGSVVVVTGVRNIHQDGITYDLTVGKLHTYYVLAGAAPVLVHNCGGAEDATEIASKKADEYHESREAARSAALRAHGVSDESLVETRTIYGKNNENLRGPNGEPYANGHYFADNNTLARPHYHGPSGEHFSYGDRVW